MVNRILADYQRKWTLIAAATYVFFTVINICASLEIREIGGNFKVVVLVENPACTRQQDIIDKLFLLKWLNWRLKIKNKVQFTFFFEDNAIDYTVDIVACDLQPHSEEFCCEAEIFFTLIKLFVSIFCVLFSRSAISTNERVFVHNQNLSRVVRLKLRRCSAFLRSLDIKHSTTSLQIVKLF